MDLPWISVRQPTARDADEDGDVICLGDDKASWYALYYDDVPPNKPWLAFPFAPKSTFAPLSDELRQAIAEAVAEALSKRI